MISGCALSFMVLLLLELLLSVSVMLIVSLSELGRFFLHSLRQRGMDIFQHSTSLIRLFLLCNSLVPRSQFCLQPCPLFRQSLMLLISRRLFCLYHFKICVVFGIFSCSNSGVQVWRGKLVAILIRFSFSMIAVVDVGHFVCEIGEEIGVVLLLPFTSSRFTFLTRVRFIHSKSCIRILILIEAEPHSR